MAARETIYNFAPACDSMQFDQGIIANIDRSYYGSDWQLYTDQEPASV